MNNNLFNHFIISSIILHFFSGFFKTKTKTKMLKNLEIMFDKMENNC